MLINPRTAIENGWIMHPQCKNFKDWEDKKFVSPNAIDFTLDKMFHVEKDDHCYITEVREFKKMRGSSQHLPTSEGYWVLAENSLHDGLSDMYVDLPKGVASLLVPRSTFVRNGLFTSSGLYDSGFKGHIGFFLHNRAGLARVEVGVRVGQIMFVESGSSELYAGGYNHVAGTNAPHQR